jgi:hypothetical protein
MIEDMNRVAKVAFLDSPEIAAQLNTRMNGGVTSKLALRTAFQKEMRIGETSSKSLDEAKCLTAISLGQGIRQ